MIFHSKHLLRLQESSSPTLPGRPPSPMRWGGCRLPRATAARGGIVFPVFTSTSIQFLAAMVRHWDT